MKKSYISPEIFSQPVETGEPLLAVSTDGISAPGLWFGTEFDCHIYDDLI